MKRKNPRWGKLLSFHTVFASDRPVLMLLNGGRCKDLFRFIRTLASPNSFVDLASQFTLCVHHLSSVCVCVSVLLCTGVILKHLCQNLQKRTYVTLICTYILSNHNYSFVCYPYLYFHTICSMLRRAAVRQPNVSARFYDLFHTAEQYK